MVAMRTMGYVFSAVGGGIVLLAFTLRRPSYIGLNGHSIGSWLLWALVGIALVALGIGILRIQRTN